MHLVPAPAVKLMKRRVLSRPGVDSVSVVLPQPTARQKVGEQQTAVMTWMIRADGRCRGCELWGGYRRWRSSELLLRCAKNAAGVHARLFLDMLNMRIVEALVDSQYVT